MAGNMGADASAPGGAGAGEAEHVAQLSAFLGIGSGKMTATYKPVLLRCLLDIGRHNVDDALPGSRWIEDDGEHVRVNLHFVAARFAKYYWDMGVSFELRQSHHHDGSAVSDLIGAYRASSRLASPPTIGDLASESHRGLREGIMRIIKKDALWRLQRDTCRMYVVSPDDDDVIVLKSSIVPFFRRHRVIIQNALNHKLAAHLEVCNGELPKIATTTDRMPLTVAGRPRGRAVRR